MTIIPAHTFELLFYIIVFLFGLDYTISGILVFRDENKNFKKPKLLGIWIIHKLSSLYGSTNQPKLFSAIYSIKSMALQSLAAGLLIIVGSLVMIIDLSIRLF